MRVTQASRFPAGEDLKESKTDLKRTSSGGFQTKEGTLYVSQPFRSGKSKKARAVISFVPRHSTFDSPISGSNEFRVRQHATTVHRV